MKQLMARTLEVSKQFPQQYDRRDHFIDLEAEYMKTLDHIEKRIHAGEFEREVH